MSKALTKMSNIFILYVILDSFNTAKDSKEGLIKI